MPEWGDQLLVLITCTNDEHGMRYAVYGRMRPIVYANAEKVTVTKLEMDQAPMDSGWQNVPGRGEMMVYAQNDQLWTNMKMVGEDPAKVAIHVAMQRQQERELRDGLRAKGVKLPGKRASGHVYYEDVDEEYQGNGNIVSVAAQKAAQGRKELAKSKSRDNKEASGGGEDRTAAMFRRMYEQMKEAK